MKMFYLILVLLGFFFISVPSFAQAPIEKENSREPRSKRPRSKQKTKPKETPGLKLEAWQLVPVSLVLSPLILSTTQSDMNYAESFAVSSIGSVVLVGSVVGGAMLAFSAAFTKNSGFGVISVILGASLVFTAPLLSGVAMQGADSLFNDVNTSLIPPLAVVGATAATGLIFGLVLSSIDLESEEVAPFLFALIALNLATTTVAYALARDVEEPTMTTSLPIIRF